MKPHTIFLRAGGALPDEINLTQEQFCRTWTFIEDTTPAVLDEKIRAAGWYFMWLADTSSCSGVSSTATSATDKAIRGALKRIQKRFNAAELESIKLSKYLGFQVARVTLHARHIQQSAILGLIDG
ncbi:MAG TPA: hypothetical protein VN517_12515 [Terriglobales bacterium]|nr:hypothetical protein [Terriglobales bacterium]